MTAAPLPPPGPNDWLANHREPGQTFEQFVASRPNRPDARHRTIYLQPLGGFRMPLEPLQRFAEAFFMMPVTALPATGIENVTSRRNPHTQLLTTDILELLRQRLPRDAFCMAGITMTDLYPDPAWNFVFGMASLRDRVGVWSFARYSGDGEAKLLERSRKVLVHETSHMFGIQHCIFYRCVMNGSNHLAESDARPMTLCPIDLKKLQWSVGFDVEERERRIIAACAPS
jgi:archaemetzincin